jgi:hypothetical protein
MSMKDERFADINREGASCCGLLERFMEHTDLPFNKPITLSMKDMSMDASRWFLRCVKVSDATDKVLKAGGVNIVLNFCPFCGTALSDVGKGMTVERVESLKEGGGWMVVPIGGKG